MIERIASRAVAFGLSGLITAGIVATLFSTADTHHAQACLSQTQSLDGTQQAAASAQRPPRI
ncbi:MAG: hypothetical protein LKCHEGNO_02304 [Burkholderiaceae bacterium]|nr:hypothetical protein [Burkholderiaceae bacterium]